MQCTKLNAHLFSLRVTDSPQCAYNLEDNSHFLLHCPIYLTSRQKMLQALHALINANNLHVDTLLYGATDCDFDKNKTIFEIVHQFILENNRL